MRNLPVNWSEGLFLVPQHFQAADQHYQELIARSGRFDSEYNYGLRRLELNRDALANQTFQVQACEARTRDGTIVVLGPGLGQEPGLRSLREPADPAKDAGLQGDIKSALAQDGVTTLFLALPKWRQTGGNVAEGPTRELYRFSEVRANKRDETRDDSDQEVALKALNVRLKTSADNDLSNFEILELGRVKLAGAQGGPELDTDYIPPLLAIDAWPALQIDIVQRIYNWIGAKIEVLAEQVISRGITLTSQDPGDLDRLMMLQVLNGCYTGLYNLAYARGVHPFLVYNELCRIVGQLAIFDPSRRPSEIPLYDHDDLGGIFKKLMLLLRFLLDVVNPSPKYKQRCFLGSTKGLKVDIDPEWLEAAWKWFVGVNYKNIAPEKLHELLESSTSLEGSNLQWKLGSEDKVDYLFEKRMPGVKLEKLPQAPRDLTVQGNWLYYQIDQSTPAWSDVKRTSTLAMRLQVVAIENKDQLRGQRKIILNYQNSKVELEFWLFAIRTN